MNFLGTEEGVVIACFTSSMLSLNKSDVVEYPAGSVFSSIVGGVIVGKLFNLCTPEKLRPYVAVGIIGLSLASLAYRVFNGKSSRDNTSTRTSVTTSNRTTSESSGSSGVLTSFIPPFITFNYFNRSVLSNPLTSNMTRVSYTAHQHLENVGPSYELSDKLSVDNILKTLGDHSSEINAEVNSSLDTIRKTLIEHNNINLFKGVYIHDKFAGFVKIVTTNEEVSGDVVVSINIS
ncbi:hypothetical protein YASMINEVIRUS_1031 [Yasminevirus sp. GU-2018]|uniref:Uncharacterized protein n=1 Tax=Yasminevirus sp. GU-2018 TaxID=2420051 RepID=A0A5K0U985_9VIRU|nr:hypothetical protein YASMINEVIRUS_1031 [Yasminevirus sp. GU-2018]